MAETVLTTDQKITQVADEISKLTIRNTTLAQQIPIHQSLSRNATASGDYAEGKRISDLVDQMDAERQGNEIKLQSLKAALVLLQDQRAVEIAAEAARTKQLNANADLTKAQSNLPAEQLFQLQLEQQRAATEIQNKKNELAAASSDADKAAKDKKTIWYIGAAIGLVIVIAVSVIIYKKVSK